MMPNSRKPFSAFLSPRYALTWLVMGLLKALASVPFRLQERLAGVLTPIVFAVSKRRVRICRTNLEKVFPSWSAERQASMLRACFRSFVLGAVESNFGYWNDRDRFWAAYPSRLEGLEHLKAALALGKGVIVCGYHFHLVEVGCRMVGEIASAEWGVDSAVVYRPHKNPLVDRFLYAWRHRYATEVFRRKELKQMLKWLGEGKILLYAPDQDFGPGPSVFAPFMGIQTATVTATARLVQATGATLIPGEYFRKPDGQRVFRLLPPLPGYPSGDPVQDATQLNHVFEAVAREYPEQYLWQHRRFKTRPPGEPEFYGE